MLLRPLRFSFPVLLLAWACNDTTPTYPAIVIYETPSTVSTGGSTGGSDGSGATDAAAGAGGAADTHCEDPWSGPGPAVQTVQCDLSALTDGGELSGDIAADQTLTSGNSYRLQGTVRVLPGVTLTIQPCVKIMGESSGSALAVLAGSFSTPVTQCAYQSGKPSPGGKLIAVGEPLAPIVFTSAKPKGMRAPGDWLGLYLMGNAQNNLAAAGTRVRLFDLNAGECHGWNTSEFNGESSGQLAYVRVEYASRTRGQDASAGLTLASVGSGTELHHVMVSNSADNAFGFQGGSVNADHLIGLNANGSLFDAQDGFSGKLQFVFGRQFPVTPQADSHGIHVEGAQARGELPLTSEQISNFTLCGGGALDLNPSRNGIVLDHSASGVSLMNGLMTGFAGAGLFVQTDQSKQASVSYVQAFNNASGLLTKVNLSDPALIGETDNWFLSQPGNSAAAADQFCDCWSNPPVAVAASAGQGTKPVGFADESARYLGAFKDPSAASNWMRGWTDWSSQ